MDYDDDMKKGVIDQMMGELDDVTASDLKKPAGPAKGVEISITVSPKSGDEAHDADGDADDCMVPDCEDPAHDHTARDSAKGEGEDSDYIQQLLKKLG